jgi:hypothetical protein
MKIVLTGLTACLIASSGMARAGDALSFDKYWLTPNVGTLGLGIEGGTRWNDYWGGRLSLNGGAFDYVYHDKNADLHNSVSLLSGGATADYYPFAGDFRVSAGIRLSDSKIDGRMKNLVKHGKHYTVVIDDPLTSYTVRQNAIQPYLGIGYSAQINERTSLSFDLGALYAGTPRLSVNSHAEEFGFTEGQIKREIDHERDRISRFTFYPVAQIGFKFRF